MSVAASDVEQWLAVREIRLTVLTLTSKETRDVGRFARQFFKWTSEISAAVDCALRFGAILLASSLPGRALSCWRGGRGSFDV